MTELTRRRFLTIGGSTGLWLATGCRSETTMPRAIDVSTTILPSTLTLPSTTSTTTGSGVARDDRVLVLVQLLGGNDPLNTVVPSSGLYRDSRPTLALPESGLLPLAGAGGLAFHAAMAPLLPLWDQGNLAVAAGVAFDEQTRSHFESRDVWWRGSDDPGADGWLARWMDAAAIDQPDEPMEALALGVGARNLAGSGASAVSDPTDVAFPVPGDMTAGEFESALLALSSADATDSAIMSAARNSLPAAISTQKILAGVADASGDAYLDRQEPALSLQLQAASSLIRTRPGLRVVTVGIEGFDTHADQLQTHASLLGNVATALGTFWESLGFEHQQRTLVMTTTEFGRRVAENGSEGTDHGRASTQLLLGGGVLGGQAIGGYEFDRLENGDLPTAVPALDLYADALRWLGGPVQEVLGSSPPSTGLLAV